MQLIPLLINFTYPNLPFQGKVKTGLRPFFMIQEG